MEQGQPGRPPLGDTLQATRHFLTDAVVFDDYTMHEGMVIPSGTLSARAITRRPVPNSPSSSPACPGAIPLPRWPLSAPMGCWVMPRWRRPSVTMRTGRAGGSPLLDLGARRDGRLVSAPDVWPPDRRRCHAAARLTRRAPPAAPSRRRGATADRPSRLGSTPGPRLLALPVAHPGGLADVCPRHPARDPECPSAGGPSAAGGWGGHGSAWLPVSSPPGCGLLASPPDRHAGDRPALCRSRRVKRSLCRRDVPSGFVPQRRLRGPVGVPSAPGPGGGAGGRPGRAKCFPVDFAVPPYARRLKPQT